MTLSTIIAPVSRPSTGTVARWIGVGSSAHADPRRAVMDACSAALTGSDPRLAVVFCAPRLATPALAEQLAVSLPGVPTVGCTTNGEIGGGVAGRDGVTVSILGGDGFVVETAVAENASADIFSAGAGAAAASSRLGRSEHRVVLLLSDALSGNQQDVVRGAFSEVGASVPLVGGCAGDDSAMTKTHQIHEGRIHTDAVVAAAIGSDSPIGIGVRHGWSHVGEPMLVTASGGTTVHEIDGEPALDVYVSRLGVADEVVADPADFTRFAMTHPLGVRRRSADEVRFVAGADHRSGSLSCVSEVPEGSLVWIMEGDSASILEGTRASCSDAVARLGGRAPIGALAFDCIARRDVLGPEGLHDEMHAIGEILPGVPVGGFYTYGEFARVGGVRGFHNQTLVTLAFS